uniref:E3 ubiquitin-protein ligase n=1 Tax=Schizaphis graminum TaxID=13262 RepID=A0A2S2PUF7_SCHGA
MATLAAEVILVETEAAAESSSTARPITAEVIAENLNSTDKSAASTVASATSSSSSSAAVVVSVSDSDSDEIVTISQNIRRALECPICLTLMSVISCYCPNGHAVCESCMLTLLNMSSAQERCCPFCRALMVQSLFTSAMVDKLNELCHQVKVKCSNWSRGCTELVPVRYVNEHESRCLYMPNVPCQVTVCQWLGIYEQLYEHVSSSHPGVAVQTSTNQLNVTDAQDITTNRRRIYLIQSTCGMIWVILSRIARSRIQTALFLVNNHLDGYNNHVKLMPTDIVYRVTWFNANERSRTKSRTKRVYWSTSLKPEFQLLLSDSYPTFRFKTGRMEINWFQCPKYTGSHSSSTC